MRKLIITGVLLAGFVCQAYAQDDIFPFGYYIDALRFSNTSPGGTTRIQSIGGAQVSLGGDLSSALSNPAGLGFFNRSEFSLTPGYDTKNVSTEYLGNNSTSSLNNFNLQNLGLAIHQVPKTDGAYKGGTFGFSVTRINDFNNNFTYQGINENTSIIDAFIEQSNGATTDQFQGNDLKSLAYFNYLIGPLSILEPPGPEDEYFTDVTGIPDQFESVETSGRQYQWSFSYGANFNDKLYVGLGLGIVSLNYQSNRIYSELFVEDPLNELFMRENLTINGTGVNGTFGFIFRPNNIIRFGGSVTTPTSYAMEDSYDAEMATDWNNFFYEDGVNGDTLLNNLFAQTEILVSEYRVVTPWRFNGGVTVFLNKFGFISFDVDYNDYSSAKLKSEQIPFEDDNAYIERYAGSALNIRTGIELRLNIFRLRGGYSSISLPESEFSELNGSGNSYSGGIGIKIPKFFADFGVVYSDVSRGYVPYFVSDATPVVNVNNTKTRFLLTIGTNF